jgi:hypothetical protein
MTPIPRGPWLSDADRIGPFLKVCALTYEAAVNIAMLVGLFLAGSPFVLGYFAYATCSTVQADLNSGPSILLAFTLAWFVLSLLAIIYGVQVARKRLLLGEHGIALWLPWRTQLVLWDDLGIAWRLVSSPAHADQPLTVLLEHTSGERVAITSAFEDHHVIALRVLDELGRNAPGRTPEQHKDCTTDAIKPADRDITEPRT